MPNQKRAKRAVKAKQKKKPADSAKVTPDVSRSRIPVNNKIFASIQPKGGISFKDEKYIKTGDGYEAIVIIYEWPSSYNEFWLASIINRANVVAAVDISNEDMNKIRQNINKSVKEHRSRYSESKNATDSSDSAHRIQELNDLYDEITAGEVVKLLLVRLFVFGRTLQEVDDSCKKIMDELESNGYKAAVMLNETKNDWSSMFKPYSQQMTDVYKKDGQAMPSKTLAAGNPFHFTALADPFGSFFGETETGGTVLLDLFGRTKTRMSYNGVAVGSMGAGKSTTLKKILEDRAMRGDYVRCFDPTGEYSQLVTALGGKIISLDGSNGVLNALEVLKTDESEAICFSRHLSKLSTVYKLLNPSADHHEIMAFERLIRNFYVKCGLLSNDEDEDIQVTGYPSEQYPTWSG